jgi:3-phytase
VYRREGEAGNAHDHEKELAVVNGGADSTDGLEIVSTPLGARFPRGLMIAMNSDAHNFLVYDWRDVMLSAR